MGISNTGGVKVRYEYREVVIPANKQTELLGIDGRYIYIADTTDDFEISIDSGPFALAKQGLKLNTEEFGTLKFKNSTGAPIAVKLYVTDGTIDINQLAISGSIVAKAGDSLTNNNVTVTNAPTLISAANTSISRRIIQNNGSNDLYLGGSGVSSTNGIKILPQSSFAIDSGAAIYGITSTGSTDVRLIEVQ